MIHKKMIIIGLFCLFLAAYANANITITQPTTPPEITITPDQNAVIQITIKNTGDKTITEITPYSDLNTEFSDTGFGLDPDKEKTITATIQTNRTIKGKITIQNASLIVKINVLNEQIIYLSLWESTQQEWTQHKDVIYITCFIGIITLFIIQAHYGAT